MHNYKIHGITLHNYYTKHLHSVLYYKYTNKRPSDNAKVILFIKIAIVKYLFSMR